MGTLTVWRRFRRLGALAAASLIVILALAPSAVAVVYGRVDTASGARLRVRSCPYLDCTVIGYRNDGERVPIYCHRRGDWVSGTFGRSNLWDYVGGGGYVADSYVYTGSDGPVAPWC